MDDFPENSYFFDEKIFDIFARILKKIKTKIINRINKGGNYIINLIDRNSENNNNR